MKRNVWFVVVLLISLYCVLSFSNKVLSYKAPYGITQFEALSEQETDSVDVLFVGTSHVYSDINPAIIWEKSGIATFNLATGGAGLWNSYYAIQEALKTQSPKLIVLELFGVTFPNLEYRADREIMDAVEDTLSVLLDSLQKEIRESPDEYQKQYFDMLEMLRHVLRVSKKNESNEPITLAHGLLVEAVRFIDSH